jgi:hypothetical protein
MVRRALSFTLAWLLAALWPAAALAAELSGSWEVQTMGGDRVVQIEQKGNKIVAHRVMWPEFEGKKYKLEHLYRGQLSGNKLDGDLLVKEDELPSFEVLRTFTGNVTSDDKITIDGLPMKRTGKAAAGDAKPSEPVPAAPTNSERPSDSPGLAQAKPTPAPSPPPIAPKPPTGPATGPRPPPAEEPTSNLFASIMDSPGMSGMFEVALKVDIPEEAKSLTDEADRLFGNGAYAPALIKYQEAQKAAGGPRVEFLHRIGRCHLKLNELDEARDVLKRALKLDPANAELKKAYKAASEKPGKTKNKGKGKSKAS